MSVPFINQRPRFTKTLQHDDGWVEAQVANSPGAIWLPDGVLSKAEMPSRREVRRQRNLVNQLSQNYGKFFTSTTTSAGNVGRGVEKPPSAVNFGALRALSYSSQIDILIIRALKSAARRFGQICDVPGKQKGFRVVHRRYLDPDFDANTKDIQRRCAEMEELLKHPTNPPHASFMDFLLNSIQEQLVFDRRCIVLPKDRGGRIGSYHLIDGSTIKPVLEVLAPWMRENNVTNSEQARYKMQVDLWRNPPTDRESGAPVNVDLSDAAYVQVLEGRVVNAWTAEEMYVAIADSTIAIDHAFYGTSPLEASIYLSILFGKALRFNANLFDVTFPEGILAITGDYDEEGVEAFKRAALDFDPSEASSRLPVITGDQGVQAQLISLRESPDDMKMVEMLRMLANFKCAAYRVHPSIINVPDEGQPLVGNESDAELEQAVGEGFHGLMIEQANMLTYAIVSKRYDDLIVIVEGLDDESEQQRIERQQAERALKTFNEQRVEIGLKELPEELPTNIGDFIADATFIQIYEMKQQEQQAQKQQDMGQYEQGDFGQGADEQGQPWGADQGDQQDQQGGDQQDQQQAGTSGADQGEGDAEEAGRSDAKDSADEAGNPFGSRSRPTGAPTKRPFGAQAQTQKSQEETVTIRITGHPRTLADLIGGRDDEEDFTW